jgi:signal peptidase II
MASKSGSFKGKDGFKIWLGLSTLVVILDQLTKFITLTSINESTTKPITSFLNWVLVYNPGAAFSILAQSGGWQKWFFIGIGSIAAIVMIWLLKRHSHQGIFSFSISLLLGGAIGNVIDRFMHGAVVDFIDVYYQTYHWPAFNLADSAITLGTALLIIDELKRVTRHH